MKLDFGDTPACVQLVFVVSLLCDLAKSFAHFAVRPKDQANRKGRQAPDAKFAKENAVGSKLTHYPASRFLDFVAAEAYRCLVTKPLPTGTKLSKKE
jgi:hypothetical protein